VTAVGPLSFACEKAVVAHNDRRCTEWRFYEVLRQ
jgi:hypothetical protein